MNLLMQIIPLNYSAICRTCAFLFDSFVTSSLSTIAPTININKRFSDDDRKRQLESHTLVRKIKETSTMFSRYILQYQWDYALKKSRCIPKRTTNVIHSIENVETYEDFFIDLVIILMQNMHKGGS